MIKIIDNTTELIGKFSAWLFFFIGLIVTYEVFMRYVFTQPTIWVDELSSVTQIWATYIGVSFALKHRDMIVIDIAFRDPNSLIRKILETFSLFIIIIFSSIAIRYGFEIWLDSTLKGHTTDTYLALPKWFTQASIWVGFSLLLLQAIAEVFKVWTVGIVEKKEEEITEESI
jgi:TRAP-type C4-dicarboxylate transport system permease small subunit